jgi:hypothetical protein
VTVTVPVTATGDRDATVVVQGYVAPVDPPVDREPKALKTMGQDGGRARDTSEVALTFGPEAFRRWDPSRRRPGPARPRGHDAPGGRAAPVIGQRTSYHS